MTEKHFKCWTSLVMKEMQIETTKIPSYTIRVTEANKKKW